MPCSVTSIRSARFSCSSLIRRPSFRAGSDRKCIARRRNIMPELATNRSCQETMTRNRTNMLTDEMLITIRQTHRYSEDSLGSAKRPLGIDHPFDLAQCGEEGLEGCRLGQDGLVGEELQPPDLVSGGQPFEEQATERRESTCTERK